MGSMIHPYEEMVIKQRLNPVPRHAIRPAQTAPAGERAGVMARIRMAIAPADRFGFRRQSAETCAVC